MVSNLIKISICATSLAVIAALGQQPLWANDTELSSTDSTSSDASDSPDESIAQPAGVSAAPVSTYMEPYTTTLTGISSASPRKRKIPEPSAVIGLMAIAGWLGTQHRKIRKG